MRITLFALLLAAFGNATTQQSPARTAREVMFEMVVPASDAIFEAAEPPANVEAWATLRKHGATLEDAGTLLGADAERGGNAEWKSEVELYLAASHALVAAAEARNFERFTEASDKLAETCVSCHARFLPKQ